MAGEASAPLGSHLDVELKEIYLTGNTGEIIGEALYGVWKVHGVSRPSRAG